MLKNNGWSPEQQALLSVGHEWDLVHGKAMKAYSEAYRVSELGRKSKSR